MYLKKIKAAAMMMTVIISCDDQPEQPDYFMTAEVNGMEWSADKGYGVAQLDYNSIADAHYLWIWSQTSNPLADGIRYQVSMDVHHPVSTGKFYFNNDRSSKADIGGVSGGLHVWAKNGTDDYFSAYSINGFIEITGLTKKSVTGTFEYTAVTARSSSHAGNDTISVDDGKFHVPINAVTGRRWNGP